MTDALGNPAAPATNAAPTPSVYCSVCGKWHPNVTNGCDYVPPAAPAPPDPRGTPLWGAAVSANREINEIRLRVLKKYPSGRLDLCPLESHCYEVRLLMSAVIRATEDLRRYTGMLDGAPNIMPPPDDARARGGAGSGAPPTEQETP